MKRTKTINLHSMRKGRRTWPAKPLAVAVAAAVMVGCSSDREAQIYRDVAQCIAETGLEGACQSAHDYALASSHRSGPKYGSLGDCAYDFGRDNCVPYSDGVNNWFMPAMAGFMLARGFDDDEYELDIDIHTAPLYSSSRRSSSMYGKWSTVDGNLLGKKRYGKVTTSSDAFKPKPSVTRTMSRGGFGSTVAAKSNWGGKASGSKSSSKGWGG